MHPLNRRDSLLRRAFAIWTAFVWVTGIRNFVIGGDHSFSFRVIHGALALVSIAFAVGAWRIAGRLRRGRLSPELTASRG